MTLSSYVPKKRNDSSSLSPLITAALLAGGFWFFTRGSGFNPGSLSTDNNNNNPDQQQTNQPPDSPNSPATSSQTFALPTTVPSGTTVRIEGSTSMVQINQALKNSFEQQFPGTSVNTRAAGTDNGIKALIDGNVEIAAISRPLSSQETAQNLAVVPITKDAIAIVVGDKNPFRKGLSQQQVVGIFQGRLQIGQKWGTSGSIKVINRPPVSGTHQAFQELVLKGGNFGTASNITTLQQDATTPLLRALGTDGIGYATYAQVANQQTVRTVAVDGLTPEAANYPYRRSLYYAYKKPANPQVQAFLGYVSSDKGKDAIASANEASK